MPDIGLDAIKIDYASIADAKAMTGLRLVLGNYAVPGPWREACKGIFHVKGISYTPVVAASLDGNDQELKEWTSQSSAPVAIWNDEPPRSKWFEQLQLAERRGPNPSLIPSDIDDRMLMFGYCNEICGENGYAWSKRLMMIDSVLQDPATDEGTKAFWTGFGEKYGYSAEAAAAAPARMAAVVEALAKRLAQQKATGSKFLVGNKLYVGSDFGIATCVNALTGELHWQERVGGNHSASPIFANEHIYFQNEEGITTVIKPGAEFQVLARNQLEDSMLASMAAVGSALYIRTESHLYRIEETP